MKFLSWNVRGAREGSAVWNHVLEIDPDIAMLQEVGAFPDTLRERFNVLAKNAVKKDGSSQRFQTAIITKFAIDAELAFCTGDRFVAEQADFFKGNLVGATLRGPEKTPLHVVSVYTPAWPVRREKWLGSIDVAGLKLVANPDIWATEILWALLRETMPTFGGEWVVGGDFNSSETFDFRRAGDRGNREIMSRMTNLGLIEVLRSHNGGLVPTFRHSRGGAIVHQLDHLYLSPALANHLKACTVGSQATIFGKNLSDHLPLIADCRDLLLALGGGVGNATMSVGTG